MRRVNESLDAISGTMVLHSYWKKTLLLDPELLKKTGVFALVSGELLTFIGGGFLLGRELDKRFETAPWIAGGLATLGLIYSVWRIQWLGKRWMKKQQP